MYRELNIKISKSKKASNSRRTQMFFYLDGQIGPRRNLSNDSSGNPFVPGFCTKDWNVKRKAS